MTAEQIMKEAKAFQEELIAERRYLHTHPETGFDLTDTLPFVKKELEKMSLAIDSLNLWLDQTIASGKIDKNLFRSRLKTD